MRYRYVPLLSAWLLSAGPAVALDCSKTQGHFELVQCLRLELRDSETKLSKAYQQALSNAGATTSMESRGKWREALIDTQRAWIKYRDLDCGKVVAFEWFDGSGRGPAMSGCQIEKDEARIKELKRMN
jgi:uncharacterized protein YecT (DUF1311 family)